MVLCGTTILGDPCLFAMKLKFWSSLRGSSRRRHRITTPFCSYNCVFFGPILFLDPAYFDKFQPKTLQLIRYGGFQKADPNACSKSEVATHGNFWRRGWSLLRHHGWRKTWRYYCSSVRGGFEQSQGEGQKLGHVQVDLCCLGVKNENWPVVCSVFTGSFTPWWGCIVYGVKQEMKNVNLK